MYYDVIKLTDGTMYKIGDHVLGGRIDLISLDDDGWDYKIVMEKGTMSIPKTSVLWAYAALYR